MKTQTNDFTILPLKKNAHYPHLPCASNLGMKQCWKYISLIDHHFNRSDRLLNTDQLNYGIPYTTF